MRRLASIIRRVAGGAVWALAATLAHAGGPALKIGTMSGPDAQIWAEVTKVAARDGLAIKVIEFNDYVQPNGRSTRVISTRTASSTSRSSTARSGSAATGS